MMPAHPFRVAGQGARREIIDPRNFPPARPIPLHPRPRVNSASSVTEGMPISTQQHGQISRIAQYESDFRLASSKVRNILSGQDPFMVSVIMNRLKSFFDATNKALSDAPASGGGASSQAIVSSTVGLVMKVDDERGMKRRKKESAEAYRKRYTKARSKAIGGYESESKTEARAVKTFLEEATKEDTKGTAKEARKYLKSKGVSAHKDDADAIAQALGAGFEPKRDTLLTDFLSEHKAQQEKRNTELREVAVTSRDEIINRLKSDRKREIDNAFSQLPRNVLDNYPDENPNTNEGRENILAKEGYEAVSTDPDRIDDQTSAEQLLAMSTDQGLFDGKVGRKHKFDGMQNAEEFINTAYPDMKPSESIGKSPKPAPKEDGSEPSEASSEQQVIATGSRGGLIVGYNSRGKPIYQKQGAKTSSAPAQRDPAVQPKPSNQGYQAIQRRQKVNSEPLDNPTALAKSLQVAQMFCKQAGLNVDNGRLLKSSDERLLESLDAAYERLVHVRPLQNPHHTSMHNEVVHRLREAHANPSESRVRHAIETCEHFIEVVVKESENKVRHASEMLTTKAKKKLTKAIVSVVDGELLIRHPKHKALTNLAKAIDASHSMAYEHNIETASKSLHVSYEAVCACFARESDYASARRRVEDLILLAKGERDTGLDADLLSPSHPLRLANKSVEDLFGINADADAILDHLAKGIVTDKDGSDADHDTDEFEEDQEQLEEEVSEGVNPKGEDEDDEDEVEKGISHIFTGGA